MIKNLIYLPKESMKFIGISLYSFFPFLTGFFFL